MHDDAFARLAFDRVLEEELDAIDTRRGLAFEEKTGITKDLKRGRNSSPAVGEYPRLRAARKTALSKHLVGLAFSGGGIRSATFAVGILQGLAKLELIKRIDYLSTVSGGGYAGSWLAAWIKREGNVSNVEKQLARSRVANKAAKRPYVDGVVVDEEPEPIYHLRAYSRFMAPRLGVLAADTWSGVATYLRNISINLLMLLPVAMMLVLLVRAVVWMFGIAFPIRHRIPIHLFLAIPFLLVGGVYLFLGLLSNKAAVDYLRHPRQGESPVDKHRMLWSVAIPGLIAVIYLPLALMAIFWSSATEPATTADGAGPALPSLPSLEKLLRSRNVVMAIGLGILALAGWLIQWIMKVRRPNSGGGQETGTRRLDRKLRRLVAILVIAGSMTPRTRRLIRGWFRKSRRSRNAPDRSVALPIWLLKRWNLVIFAILAPLSLGLICAQFGLPEWVGVDRPKDYGNFLLFPILFGVLLGGIFLAKEEARTTYYWRLLVSAITSGAAAGLILAAVVQVLKILCWPEPVSLEIRPYRPDLLATFAPPACLLVFVSVTIFHVAQLHNVIREDEREWWAYLDAYLIILALAWLVTFGTILYLPAAIFFIANTAIGTTGLTGLLATWIGTTIAGVLAGKSRRTASGEGSVSLETIARIAPPIFLIGLFGLLSLVATWMIDPPSSMPPPKSSPVASVGVYVQSPGAQTVHVELAPPGRRLGGGSIPTSWP